MAPPLPATTFHWAYDPAHELLTACWAAPVPVATLAASYHHLLAAAQAHGGCRFWLLDMQQRNWHDAAFAQWFSEDFAWQAGAVLGQALFIACVVQPAQRPLVEAPRTDALLRQAARHNLFPFFFDSEAAARAWLRHQQAGAAGGSGRTQASRQLAT